MCYNVFHLEYFYIFSNLHLIWGSECILFFFAHTSLFQKKKKKLVLGTVNFKLAIFGNFWQNAAICLPIAH